ncbi:MAG: DNA polymerase III subunit alpha [Opitutales bacterium]|nr:DNA polymerase III subunit alpha [Opitutales bacterium]
MSLKKLIEKRLTGINGEIMFTLMSVLVALGNYSWYSFYEGLWSPGALVKGGKAAGYGIVGLSDWWGVRGGVEFFKVAEKGGVKPILGCRVRVEGLGAVQLTVRTQDGYAALCRVLSGYAVESGKDVPEDWFWRDWETLREGVWLSVPVGGGDERPVGSVGGPIPWPKRMAAWKSRWRSEFWWELGWRTSSQKRQQQLFYAQHESHGWRWVVMSGARRAVSAGAQTLSVLRMIGELELRGRRGEKLGQREILPSACEWEGVWKRRPEVLRMTREFVDGVGFRYRWGKLFLPSSGEEGDGASREKMQRLETLCRGGMREKYGALYRWPEKPSPELREKRLQRELEVVARTGYAGYFLLFHEVLEICRERGIETLARGSAAGSLLCYALGVSNVCPFRFGLHFERFLNEERLRLSKLPDIDLDLPWDRRDEVIAALLERYGEGRVAMVGGCNTFQARAAVAEVAKTMGLPEREVRALTRLMPHGGITRFERYRDIWAESKILRDNENFREILPIAVELDGIPRHPMMHPCGLVLADRSLYDFTPLLPARKVLQDDEGGARLLPMAGMDMEAVEEMGLLKLDLLGQAGLSVLRDTIRNVEENEKGEGQRSAVRKGLARLRYNEVEIYRMIATGGARGVFHIESPAMTGLLQLCRCGDIDALVAAVSVIRPGAANEDKKEKYARRYLGQEEAVYAHPDLESILGDTYGLLVFEEHIIRVAHEWAGMNLGRADRLRRTLVRKKATDLVELEHEFRKQAVTTKGRTEAEAEEIWRMLVEFSGYMFNKAHGAAYAVEAYQGAWLKYHYPGSFLAAVLENRRGFYKPLVYVAELWQRGFRLLGPEINRSASRYRCRGREIDVPFSAMYGLSGRFLVRWQKELARGPFRDGEDFLRRVQPTTATALLLAKGGALREFYPNRFRAVRVVQRWRGEVYNQEGMLPGLETDEKVGTEGDEPPPDRALFAQWEKEIFGFPLSENPLPVVDEIVPGQSAIRNLRKCIGQEVEIRGLIVARRNLLEKNQKPMCFLTLADSTGIAEVTVFPAEYAVYGYEISRSERGCFRVKVEYDATKSGPQLVLRDFSRCSESIERRG